MSPLPVTKESNIC